METLGDRIQRLTTKVMKQIADAAKSGDLNALEQLTKRATELRAMNDKVIALESRVHSLEDGTTPSSKTVQQMPTGSREILIEVTQGMINQNLLTLSEPMKRGIVRAGERLVIKTLPSGETFETEVLESGNKLRERGRVGKFYRDAEVHAGDAVILKEVTPGRWELSKVASRAERIAEQILRDLA